MRLDKYLYADVSTNRITEEDCKLLHEHRARAGSDPMTSGPIVIEYDVYPDSSGRGWFVMTTDELIDDNEWKIAGFSDKFMAIMRSAHGHGCAIVRFDPDGGEE